jgi:hypothetical protein
MSCSFLSDVRTNGDPLARYTKEKSQVPISRLWVLRLYQPLP